MSEGLAESQAARGGRFSAETDVADSPAAELRHYAQTFRAEQAEMVAAVLKKYDVDEQSVPPMAVAFLMTVIPPVLFMEDQLDITAGHAEIVELVERYLREVEGEPIPT